MAITRRQFVTRLGALAAAVGMSQADISKMSEAFAGNSVAAYGGTLGKPRVVWIHGAECTGCSTSLLSFFEDANGEAVFQSGIKTGAALGLAGVTNASGGAFPTIAGATRDALYGTARTEHVNVADVVIDVVDLQYHETVMGMGGDLAAQWLEDFKTYTPNPANDPKKPGDYPFVLVVEGALQDKTKGGAWGDTGTSVSWCSVGMSDDGTTVEHDMAQTVVALAQKSTCVAILSIGQCAAYGGYPGCKPQISASTAGVVGSGGFDPKKSQTDAQGTYDYLWSRDYFVEADKVINVPGCPTNPWWFCLTVVMFMVNLAHPGALGAAYSLDSGRRLKGVYPIPVHSAWCPRYGDYNKGRYALKAGDSGCLQKIGCKGIGTSSLCGVHGWNNQQPQNSGNLATTLNGGKGGHCTKAGAPCMGCTEKGYPDAFVPFVKR